ncbi:MAG: 1-aminocyclopropane-1-carboxylate deaminase/D-cysteine desulfhydrase, partial [Pseudomonadales bacterium]
ISTRRRPRDIAKGHAQVGSVTRQLDYPPRLALAQTPTPLHPLRRFCARHDLPLIWLKRDDLTGSVLGGNKIRKLEFTLAQAQQEGCDVLLTCGGVQSNHCRATALLGAQLVFDVHLILRGEEQTPADGNLLLDQLAGATISYHTAADIQANLDDIFAHLMQEYAEQGRKPFVIPIGASDAIGVWGYIAACEELANDFATHAIQPRHIVSATGSGGTQAGLTAGSYLFDLGAQVWGINVCDDEEYFLQKVGSDLRDWQQRYDVSIDLEQLPIRVIDGYVGAGYARASDSVLETIHELARLEGIVFDPVYTGKAFAGMVQELQAGRFGDGDCVFIHTGGVFGLYPYKEQLRNIL